MRAAILPEAAPSHDLVATVRAILDELARHRFALGDEKVLQNEIGTVLAAAGLRFEREVKLALGSSIDFVVGRVGIEVKIKGQRRAIFRQCQRYCESTGIDALVLATNAAMGLPPAIAGKPVFMHAFGRAWL